VARSPYSDVEISISGLLSQKEAEAWIEDNKRLLDHYIDDETPWSMNENIRQHSMSGLWSANIKVNR
jgi:hypothetical protein